MPTDVLDIPKLLVLTEILFCPRDETLSKRFIKKFHELTNHSYEIRTKWITKKMKQLFKLKSRNPHPACVMYEGVCVCEQKYIGETGRNVELRREQNENISKDCETAKHLKENLSQKFFWKMFLQHQKTNESVRFSKFLKLR